MEISRFRIVLNRRFEERHRFFMKAGAAVDYAHRVGHESLLNGQAAGLLRPPQGLLLAAYLDQKLPITRGIQRIVGAQLCCPRKQLLRPDEVFVVKRHPGQYEIGHGVVDILVN